MIPFDIGDPANPNAPYTPGTPITLPGSTARLIAINDTPYQLLLTFSGLSGTPYKVPSGWARIFTLEANQQQVIWTIDASLAPTSAIISDLTIECYMPGEPLPDMHPILRQVSGSSTVIANELGTTADGLTVSTPTLGTITGETDLLPYSTQSGAERALVLKAMSGGNTAEGLRLTNTGSIVEVSVPGSLAVAGPTDLDNSAIQTDGLGHMNVWGNAPSVGQGLAAVRVAVEPPVTVTATTLQSIANVTPPANGLYVAYMRVRLNNGTSPQLMQCRVQYTDPDTGSTPAFPFQMINAAGTVQTATGVGTNFANGTWDSMPIFFRAKGLAAITLQYQDPANTPNDQVNGAILQIA